MYNNIPMLVNRLKVFFIKFWLDALIITLSFILAANRLFSLSTFLRLNDLLFLFLLIACWSMTSKSNRLYTEFETRLLSNDIFKSLYNIFMQGLFVIFFCSIIRSSVYNFAFSFYYFSLLIVLIPLEKFLVIKLYLKTSSNIKDKRNVLIIGAGSGGMKFYNWVKSHPDLGYNIVGILDDKPMTARVDCYLGKVNKLKEIFDGNLPVNEVVVALPNNEVDNLNHIISVSRNEAVRLRIMPDYSEISSRYTVDNFGGMAMINVRPEPLENFQWRAYKRAFDIIFSFVILIGICSWLFPMIAILIKINSKGPVFFKQLRAGRDKIPFYCYKFRTMYLNEYSDSKNTVKNDPRVTWIGKLLRKTSIDEMPQFVNVLLGQMAVVGPRPHMISQNETYIKIIDQYMVRQLVKPGITGWAQVCGYRGETRNNEDMQMRVEYDVWYLENWTYKLDFKIIFLTIWNMIKGEKMAY